jgi:hypothetical protein
MTPRLFAFALAALALALTGRMNTAADPKEDPTEATEEVPYEKLSETGKNVVKLTTAMKLKEIGWGKDVKGPRIEEYSLESLLAAARLLRELPKFNEAGPKAVEVTPAPDGPKGDAPQAKPFDPIAESNVILERAEAIIKQGEKSDVGKAYKDVIAEIRGKDNSKHPVGGPMFATRIIRPGEKHVFTFAAYSAAPSALAVQTNGVPIRFRMVNAGGSNVHFNQVVQIGAYTWVPTGSPGQAKPYRLEVTNPKKVPVAYTVAVQ